MQSSWPSCNSNSNIIHFLLLDLRKLSQSVFFPIRISDFRRQIRRVRPRDISQLGGSELEFLHVRSFATGRSPFFLALWCVTLPFPLSLSPFALFLFLLRPSRREPILPAFLPPPFARNGGKGEGEKKNTQFQQRRNRVLGRIVGPALSTRVLKVRSYSYRSRRGKRNLRSCPFSPHFDVRFSSALP